MRLHLSLCTERMARCSWLRGVVIVARAVIWWHGHVSRRARLMGCFRMGHHQQGDYDNGGIIGGGAQKNGTIVVCVVLLPCGFLGREGWKRGYFIFCMYACQYLPPSVHATREACEIPRGLWQQSLHAHFFFLLIVVMLAHAYGLADSAHGAFSEYVSLIIICIPLFMGAILQAL